MSYSVSTPNHSTAAYLTLFPTLVTIDKRNGICWEASDEIGSTGMQRLNAVKPTLSMSLFQPTCTVSTALDWRAYAAAGNSARAKTWTDLYGMLDAGTLN